MIIYPQKPTILAQKRSFTPNFFEFQHFFVHRPLKTSNACIEKFIYPAASSILASKSPKTPWNFWFSGFFLHSPFEIIASLAMTGLKSVDCHASLAMTGWKLLDCHALFAMTVWSHWIASLCSQWRDWSHWIATLCLQWQRKGIRFLFFIRGKLLKITSIVNFQLISSNP